MKPSKPRFATATLCASLLSSCTAQFVPLPWNFTVTNVKANSTFYEGPGNVTAIAEAYPNFLIPVTGVVHPAKDEFPNWSMLEMWETILSGASGLNSFEYQAKITFGGEVEQRYEAINIYLQSNVSNLNFQVYSVAGAVWWGGGNLPISNYYNGTIPPVGSSTWAKVSIPIASLPVQNRWDTFVWVNPGPTAAKMRWSMYYGNIDGTSKTVNWKDPADNQILPNDLQYLSMNQTYELPDTLNVGQWVCEATESPRGYQDLADVTILPYRETNGSASRVLLSMQNAHFDRGIWIFHQLWGVPDYTADAYRFPHPALACAIHNADYIEVGDFGNAKRILVVWVPLLRIDLTHAIGAYATYVKANRVNGVDTVAVHMRMRAGQLYEWGFSEQKTDCSMVNKTDPKSWDWRCPDHIWFQDRQMGSMLTALDQLAPLNELNQNYFKENGYDVAMNILPAAKELVMYSGVMYALPVVMYLYPWQLRISAMDMLKAAHPDWKRPPPQDDWGEAWWEAWNMDTFRTYMEELHRLYKANGVNDTKLLPFPVNQEDTEYFTYLGFNYGASALNVSGRCGLNDRAVKALNETLIHWYKSGMMQQRLVVDSEKDKFELWKNATPLANPLDEYSFTYLDERLANDQPGFTYSEAYNPGIFYPIYPPTGIGKVISYMVGIASTSKNQTFAYDALMTSMARNVRFQVNYPFGVTWGVNGGVSGFMSAKYTPEYKVRNRATFYPALVDHVTYVGYPVPQSPSFGLLGSRNPMGLAVSEIIFKNVTIEKALDRACTIINVMTRPPCTADNYEAYLDPQWKKGKADLAYRWKTGYNDTCNPELANSVFPPPTIKQAVLLSYISTQSVVGQAMIGISAVGLIIEFVLLVLFIWKRDAQVIRASSRTPSYFIIIGAMLTLASTIMRTSSQGELDWAQCFGTYWLFSIGYGTILGSLAMKSYRVDSIFRSRGSGKLPRKFSDLRLVGHIAAIVGGEVVLCLLYQFLIEDDSRSMTADLPSLNVALTQIDCPVVNQVPTILLYVYNAMLILIAAFYAWRTRNVISAYNENTFTASAIGLICVITVVIVPVIYLINAAQATFLLISLGTFVASVLSTLIFAIPKLLIAFGFLQMQDVSATLKSQTHSSHSATIRQSGGTGRSSSAI